jgi:MobC-like protein
MWHDKQISPPKKQKNMQQEQQIRTEWFTIRMTKAEYQQLERLAATTISSSLSDYGRRVLLQKPVSILSRNQSLDDFLADMLLLRKDLRQIGGHFNQAVHRLHTLKAKADIQHWLLLNEQDKNRLFQFHEKIFTQLNEANRLWSHA